MSTKQCPYCHEEISEDAILCKYCHNLLTDDDEATVVFDPTEQADDRTKVFSANDADNDEDQDSDYDPEDYDDYDDDDDDDDDYDESAAKKTFITAAVITLGILLIVIIAIFAGYKIFGGKNNDSKAPSLNSMVQPQNDSKPDEQSAAPVDTSADDQSVDTPDDSKPEDDTSSDSSEDETVSSEAEDSSSEAVEDSSSEAAEDSSSEAEDSSSQAAGELPADNDAIVAKAGELISSHNSSGVEHYEYRAEDSANTVMEYYYIWMNDGVPYSVAYNSSTGVYIVQGGGERFEG